MWHVEEMCGEVGSENSAGEGQGGSGADDDEAEPRPVPNFMEALGAFESVRAFMYGHITERDQANIVNFESLLFSLKSKGATKQIKINYLFKKK